MDPYADSMKALFDEAERTGKWFWCRYQDMWFSPAELRSENENGKFRWGPLNWTLRDPAERLREAEKRAAQALAEVARVRSNING